MARFILLLAPALAAPECLKSGLGKEPFQPLPSFYLANWAACAENCAKSLTCHTFSFKADSVPTSGGCWLFNQPEVTVEADAKAVTGSKECQDPAMAESSDAGAVQDAVTDTAAAAGTVADGVKAATGSAEAGTDQVAAGVESAANMAAESVQSGIDSMNGGLNGLNGIAPGHLDSITDGITSASAGGHLNMQALSLKGGHVHESVTDIKVGPYAKSLLVDGSAGNDHTLLYGVLGGGAAAALLVLGGYMLMPEEREEKKKRKKRSVKRRDVDEESAPLSARSTQPASSSYVPVPQPLAPTYLSSSYQPTTLASTYQPAQPMTYQQPAAYISSTQ